MIGLSLSGLWIASRTPADRGNASYLYHVIATEITPTFTLLLTTALVLGHGALFSQVLQDRDTDPLPFSRATALSMLYLSILGIGGINVLLMLGVVLLPGNL